MLKVLILFTHIIALNSFDYHLSGVVFVAGGVRETHGPARSDEMAYDELCGRRVSSSRA